MIVTPKTLRELDLAFLNMKNHPSFFFARWTSKHTFDITMRDMYPVKANFYVPERHAIDGLGSCWSYTRGNVICVTQRIITEGKKMAIASVSPAGFDHTAALLQKYAVEQFAMEYEVDLDDETGETDEQGD